MKKCMKGKTIMRMETSHNGTHAKKKSAGQRFKDFWVPNSHDSAQRKAGKIFSIIALIILIFALVLAGLVIRKYARGDKNLDKWDEMYVDETTSVPEIADDGVPEADEIDAETGVVKDFKDLYKTNNEVIGYISIDDTKLALPVMHGADNTFYLDKTVEKTHDPFGVPFVDYRATIDSSIQSTNLTMYGHAAKNGTYFAPVKKYKDPEYYKTHPLVKFNTIYGDGYYKVIGVCMVDVTQERDMFNYHDKIDLNDAQLMEYANAVTKRSYFTTNVDVVAGDKLITLSTCDDELDNSLKTPFRTILVARKVRPGEATAVDVSSSTKNTKMEMPDAWVAKKGKANPFS